MEDKDKTIEELTAQLETLKQLVSSLKSSKIDGEKLNVAELLQEANYSAIFNAANDAIFVHDIENGHIVDVNNKTCEMYFYPKEEMLNLSVHALSAGEKPFTQDEAMKFMRKAADDEPQIFEWLARDKLGRLFWVEVNLKRAVIGGRYRLLAMVRDIDERKQTEQRLEAINEAFLAFTTEPLENINHLTALCGKLLNADSALYNRLEKGLLCSCGQWNTPPGFNPSGKPDGHICYDVIKGGGEDAVFMPNLQDSEYAKTDPNIAQYNLKSYMGYPVKFGGACVGSLCVVYTYDYMPSVEDKKIIGILASAIGVEEERRLESDALVKRDYQLEILSRTSQHINQILEAPVILRTLVAAAMELVEANAGTAGLLAGGVMEFNEYNRGGRLEPVHYVFGPGSGVAGWVINTMKPYIANDPEHDSHILPEAGKEFGFYNLVNIPIIGYSGELLGCLSMHNKKDHGPFDTQDVFMLQGLAAGAAVALENAKMVVNVKEAASALSESGKRHKLVTENIPLHIGVIDKSGKFSIWNKYSEKMFGYTSEEAIGKLTPADIHESKEDADEVLRTAAKEGIFDRELNMVHRSGRFVRCRLVVVPYRDASGDIVNFYGFAEDITKRSEAEKSREDLHAELVKSNERLKQLALKDTQTGLYNHRYLSEMIESEFYRAKRYSHPLSLIMLDIDYFKSINDLYGHEFGDLVLKQLAHYLKRMVRRYDVVIRFGGEEFIILSSGIARDKAFALGQRILDAINLYNFGDKEHSVRLKMSVAVAAYPEDKIMIGMDLVNMADSILSKVKESGGNSIYSSENLNKEKKDDEGKNASTDVRFLKDRIEKLTKRGKQNLIESIFAFARTIELKDHYTGEHVEKTVHYATQIAKVLDLPPEEIENIKQAAVLHDLGKIGVSDKILHKKSKLSKKEYEEIKRHPQIAADIIRPVQFMHDIVPLVLYHHERWDGNGYPAGMAGDEIPMGARIIAIADVYQALTSNRTYRKAYPKNEAMRIIKNGAGTQFDPLVVDALLIILKKETPAKKPVKRERRTGIKIRKMR
ncbi:MAG: diguanylate cyclase [Candidatus Omnitrophica bacterium]|nr:diguanylate cyclase [Candidatus Omnitrophota bacterium]